MSGDHDISSTIKGTETENEIIRLLKCWPIVESVWKDHHNSKFDIYYKMKFDKRIRGLQVKTLSKTHKKNKEKPSYKVSGLNKYEDGMLIVCLSEQYGAGLIFLSDHKLDLHGDTYTISKFKKTQTFLDKNLTPYGPFLTNLRYFIFHSLIVTPEVFADSLTSKYLLEYKSTQRFITFCNKHDLKIERTSHIATPTDLFVEGLKIQLKYRSKPLRDYSHYNVTLHKSNGKNNMPYEKGDNDYYVVELGENHGYFLWFSEELLIEKGIIKTDKQQGKTSICVFPFNYLGKININDLENDVEDDIGKKDIIKNNKQKRIKLYILIIFLII